MWAELRKRLAEVEGEGYVQPRPITFETFALGWLDRYPAAQSLKTSTVEGYTCIVKAHLIGVFGSEDLNDIDTATVEAYVGVKRRAACRRALSIGMSICSG